MGYLGCQGSSGDFANGDFAGGDFTNGDIQLSPDTNVIRVLRETISIVFETRVFLLAA